MQLLRAFVVFAFCGTVAQSAQQPTAIFRSISLGFTRIELGQPFANVLLTRAVDDSTRQLRDVTFGGADAIALRYDAQRNVRAILFTYPPTHNWTNAVRDYATSLGRPVVLREDKQRPLAEWRDATTTFRVWCEPVKGVRRCSAELRDRPAAR